MSLCLSSTSHPFHPFFIISSILRWFFFFCSSNQLSWYFYVVYLSSAFHSSIHPSLILLFIHLIYFVSTTYLSSISYPFHLFSSLSCMLCGSFFMLNPISSVVSIFHPFFQIFHPFSILKSFSIHFGCTCPFFFSSLFGILLFFAASIFLTNPRVGSDFLFIHFTICFSFNFLAISFILLHPLYHTFGIHFSVMFFILFHPLLYIVSNPLPSLDCQVVWQRGFQPSGYIWFFSHPLSSKFSFFSIHFTKTFIPFTAYLHQYFLPLSSLDCLVNSNWE